MRRAGSLLVAFGPSSAAQGTEIRESCIDELAPKKVASKADSYQLIAVSSLFSKKGPRFIPRKGEN
jgi:hypothetical protein